MCVCVTIASQRLQHFWQEDMGIFNCLDILLTNTHVHIPVCMGASVFFASDLHVLCREALKINK